MSKRLTMAGMALAGGVLACLPATAEQRTVQLTDTDRREIQELATSYGRALGLCAAEEYAALFAVPDGSFASGPRGKVVGRDRLIALVRSERHCNDGSERRPRNLPATNTIEATPGGAKGRVVLTNAPGHYEDTYAKTSQGWRFKGRTYISKDEEAAKLTSVDFEEIRRLAGNDTGQFEDVYSTTPQGKQFRSAGVVIAPSPGGATGRATLKNDGGLYEDAYERTASGWRFKSRQYVPAAEVAARTGAQAVATPNR
jgi:SnoaL-like domain